MNPIEQLLIAKMFGDDKNTIPYRPKIAKVVGSITATILLQQITYWWSNQGQTAFYKFKQPCQNAMYKEGDSWCEELGFSRSEFDTAMQVIGIKKTKGQKLEDVMVNARELGMPVVFWITPGRVTYYTIVLDALICLLAKAYNIPLKQESSVTYSEKVALPNDEKARYEKQESSDTISETTPETTTDISLRDRISLIGVTAYPPREEQREYTDIQAEFNASTIRCELCGEIKEWPRKEKDRKRRENLTCTCGAYWSVVEEESERRYKVPLPTQYWAVVLDDSIPKLGNRFVCEERNARQFMANWNENPSLVVEKLQWAATQDWLTHQRNKVVARVNAAYESSVKTKIVTAKPEPKPIKRVPVGSFIQPWHKE